jgi:excisionase family DNA binding protein
MEQDKDKILKEKEAAAYLNFSYSYLKALRMRGAIRHMRIGRSVRYFVSDLREFLERRSVEPLEA